jgi:hypothetical protein
MAAIICWPTVREPARGAVWIERPLCQEEMSPESGACVTRI